VIRDTKETHIERDKLTTEVSQWQVPVKKTTVLTRALGERAPLPTPIQITSKI